MCEWSFPRVETLDVGKVIPFFPEWSASTKWIAQPYRTIAQPPTLPGLCRLRGTHNYIF